MRTSIATVSMSGDLKEKLAAIASASFDGIEILDLMLICLSGSPPSRGGLARAADQNR